MSENKNPIIEELDEEETDGEKEQPSDEFVEKNIEKIKEYSDLFNAIAESEHIGDRL